MMAMISAAIAKHKSYNWTLRTGSFYLMTLRADAKKKDLMNL